MSFKSLVNRIDTLPPLSDSAQRILTMYAQEDEDIDVRKLSRLIESDTLLTANILAMINDPKLGFNNKITSVGQAITLFGTRIIKGFILSFVMKQHIKLDMGTYGISNAKFNDMCHLQSALLFQWYMTVDIKRAQILVPLALIMETGKAIFAQEMGASDYAHLFTEEIYHAQNMEEVEYKYSDTSSYYIGGLLFEHWNFSQRYTDIMKSLDFDDGDLDVDQLDLDILDVIRTAINVKGFLNKENLDKAMALVKELELDEAAFMKAALRIKNAYEDSLRAKSAKA
ncbi:MAG: histidine kinase [Arcobacter sp.]|nr:MAG: histidine kinase [Arcobacter sp.]